MAGNADFINILREIRGSAAPGETATDGIWYELTQADTNGNAGVYGDILAKYGVVVDNTATLDQAVAIIDGLTVVANELTEGSAPTAQLVGTTLTLGIPKGTAGQIGATGAAGPRGLTGLTGAKGDKGDIGATGADGHTPTEQEVDAIVSANVNVQVAQTLLDDAIVQAETELTTLVDNKEIAYNANAVNRLTQYNDNHVSKLTAYNANDSTKLSQYNSNHIESLENINYAYADRIVEMIKTRNFMGIMDEYVAQTATHMITFLDTVSSNYIYYANGNLLTKDLDYTVYDSKTIELTVKANPYDVIVQVHTRVLKQMLTAEGALFDDRLGQPNGVASLNEVAQIPAEQLPSYVDDVLEFPTYADLPVEGETGKIYVVVTDETSNGDTSTYRWTGTVYAMVSNTLNASDVKALYEANPDTNEYSDAEKVLVDVGQVLETTATTLPTAINEIHNSLDAHKVSTGEDHTYIDQDVTIAATPTFAGIVTEGLLDGRDVSVDGTKLDTIEENAKDDQLSSEVPAVAGTNTYAIGTDVQTQLNQLDAETLSQDSRLDINEAKLATIEDGATADQTAEEIEGLYESRPDTNKYTDAEKDKVANIPNNTDLVLGTTTLTRFDKILGSMGIIDMGYLDGDLVTVRYTGDNDTNVFYRDVLAYTAGDLTTVKHYYNTADLVTERGLTTLVYDIDKNLISSSYTEV